MTLIGRLPIIPAVEPETLSSLYESHHARGDKYGFIFAGRSRGELLAGWIGTGRDVLDVGCRDGSLTKFYAAGNRVTGLDVDRQALARCQAALGITTRWCDVTTGLAQPDTAFDVVCVAEILEHIPFPDRLMSEIARVLRPGGVVVGSVPNAFRLKNRLRFLAGREVESDPTHLHWYSPRTLHQLLDSHFDAIDLRFLASRWLRLHPRLMGHDICFRGTKRTPQKAG